MLLLQHRIRQLSNRLSAVVHLLLQTSLCYNKLQTEKLPEAMHTTHLHNVTESEGILDKQMYQTVPVQSDHLIQEVLLC